MGIVMKSGRLLACLSVLLVLSLAPAGAAIIGTNQPAQGLTAARIAAQQSVWQDYLARSQAQRLADRAALAAERKPGQPIPQPPAESAGNKSMPLDRDDAYYAGAQARHVADVIVSFQTPAGGWGKNQSRDGALRLPGQAFVANNVSHYLAPGDFDTPADPQWNYVGTLDNDATTTELHFLAKVAAQAPGPEGDAWRASFIRGARYLLAAQYPNGGWPQVWPLEGGYHDAITYNDNAVTLAAQLLSQVGDGDYPFVPPELRQRSAAAAAKALDCILATQIMVKGRRTIWGQQHDPLTLAPVSARNFEPALPATGESADLLVYLMGLPDPSPQLQQAIRAGMQWLKDAAVYGYAWTRTDNGRQLVAQPGAGPIWARYYTADPIHPVFGDRDKSLHDDVNELTLERRNGYSWYGTAPLKALTAYAAWSAAHPAQP
jgi:PelA/Pel-15E family pectate lyase